jgi:hypothetical protein
MQSAAIRISSTPETVQLGCALEIFWMQGNKEKAIAVILVR